MEKVMSSPPETFVDVEAVKPDPVAQAASLISGEPDPKQLLHSAQEAARVFAHAEARLLDYVDTLLDAWRDVVLDGLRANSVATSPAHGYPRDDINYNASFSYDGVQYMASEGRGFTVPVAFIDPDTRGGVAEQVARDIAELI